MDAPPDRYIVGGREAIPEAVIWAEWLALPDPGRMLYRDYLRRRSMDAPIGPCDLRRRFPAALKTSKPTKPPYSLAKTALKIIENTC